MRRRRNDTKRLVGCTAAILLLATVIGLIVYFLIADPSPAKKLMRDYPYSFLQEKTVGAEKQDSFAKDGSCFYIAYPKLKNNAADEKIGAYTDEIREKFTAYAEGVAEEDERIPRLIIDYKTEKQEGYSGITLFYEMGLYNEEGEGKAEESGERCFYLDADNKLLDLDGVLGEDSIKKIDLMLKYSKLSTADMIDFSVKGDELKLRWADEEKILSVNAVERGSLIDPEKPMIALTFDDGPGKYSREFADLLAEYGGHGTFFVLGINVLNFADEVKYVYEMGNEIASHTMRHKNLNIQSSATVQAELDEAAEAIHDATGAYPTLVRTPYGNANSAVMDIIDGPMIKWSVDTLDWQHRDPAKLEQCLLEEVKDGDIVLMHEIYESTYDGLKRAIGTLAAKGYQFVTVSELMQYRGIEPEQDIYFSCYPD